MTSSVSLKDASGGSGAAVSSSARLERSAGRDQLDTGSGGQSASRPGTHDETRERGNDRQRRRRRQIGYGRWVAHVKIDPGPYREHLLELRATYGLSLQGLSALTGLSARTMVDLVHEPDATRRDWITVETAARIRAARFDLDRLPDTCRVSSVGSLRRVQALALQGYSRSELARRRGVSMEALIASLGRPTIGVSIAREIRDLYEELIDTQGPCTRAIRSAVSQGWAPAHAWDEESIDDPGARPTHDMEVVDEVAIERVLSGIPTPLTRTEFLEVVRRGTEAGMSAEELGRFLGRTKRTIRRDRALLRERGQITREVKA